VVSVVSLDDRTVIEAARSGDVLAFDSLIGPLVEPAYKLAVVMLRSPHEAEDAVQEACLKAWTNLARLRDTSVRPWFLTIVANQCRSIRRSRWWSVIRTETMPDESSQPASRHDDALDLDREMAQLPETDRAALFLFFYLDLPLKEIARVMRISPQAAKSRVHRAVARLRLSMTEDIR
jgi:RNA polymerase sigma-70 factor (ECF subfamily)